MLHCVIGWVVPCDSVKHRELFTQWHSVWSQKDLNLQQCLCENMKSHYITCWVTHRKVEYHILFFCLVPYFMLETAPLWCYLRIYYSGLPLIQVKNKMNQNSWITPGIITSYKHKRELYKELNNNNHNPTVISYCRDYFKIWSVVIKKNKKNWTWQIYSKLV